MSALFNFQSLLSVILLLICTCAYFRSFFPSIMDRNKTGEMFYLTPMVMEEEDPNTGFSAPFGNVQELVKENLLMLQCAVS